MNEEDFFMNDEPWPKYWSKYNSQEPDVDESAYLIKPSSLNLDFSSKPPNHNDCRCKCSLENFGKSKANTTLIQIKDIDMDKYLDLEWCL